MIFSDIIYVNPGLNNQHIKNHKYSAFISVKVINFKYYEIFMISKVLPNSLIYIKFFVNFASYIGFIQIIYGSKCHKGMFFPLRDIIIFMFELQVQSVLKCHTRMFFILHKAVLI